MGITKITSRPRDLRIARVERLRPAGAHPRCECCVRTLRAQRALSADGDRDAVRIVRAGAPGARVLAPWESGETSAGDAVLRLLDGHEAPDAALVVRARALLGWKRGAALDRAGREAALRGALGPIYVAPGESGSPALAELAPSAKKDGK